MRGQELNTITGGSDRVFVAADFNQLNNAIPVVVSVIETVSGGASVVLQYVKQNTIDHAKTVRSLIQHEKCFSLIVYSYFNVIHSIK